MSAETTTELTGAALLLEAARQMWAAPDMRWRAVAAWLHTAGADLWAHGPLHCSDGCDECDDDLWAPHVRHAFIVAREFLGLS